MLYASGVSDTVISLCTKGETIASALSKGGAKSSVHDVWLELYPKPFVLKRLVNRFTIKHDCANACCQYCNRRRAERSKAVYHGRGDPTKEDLDRAEKCGKFPYRPSDLFLKVRVLLRELANGQLIVLRISASASPRNISASCRASTMP